MATYYVRSDGNDANSGLGPAANQAWQTITKALGATGIGSGDTLYIAPGNYRYGAQINVLGTYTAPTFVYGNPTATQFTGITPGRVLITTRLLSDFGSANVNQQLFVLTNKNYLNFENLVCETATNRSLFLITDCIELKWRKCLFINGGVDSCFNVSDTTTTGLTKNYLFQQCQFIPLLTGGMYVDATNGKNSPATQDYVYGLTFDRCVALGSSMGVSFNGGNATYQGTTFNFFNNFGFGFSFGQSSGRSLVIIRNNVTGPNGIIYLPSAQSTCIVTNNYSANYQVAGLAVQSNNYINSYLPFNTGIWRLWGMTQYDWFSANELYTYAAGSTIGTPSTDFYGEPWAGGTPNIGSYNNTTATIAGQYQPTERTNNSFTVSPNTTNRSELIYLGAKGITHTTPLLSASYVRAGAIRTAITLVSQTPNGSWTSGGFCEIDSTNMPGIYRIDVPNALFVAGAESAMLQLTGLNTSNGAVVHYNMAKVQFDLSQNVPLTNTAHSIGDALNAARAQGFGKWQIVGNTMNIYAEDGITLVKSFNLDSGSYPTQRM